ncbi:MAG: hypothetical protein M1822_009937 [Bathelium mastoideum]|nr:MAG: hypothetical protein M1822_009937 [Bathelium mastoideum]
MAWFVQRQQLDAVFGSANHGQPNGLKCSKCEGGVPSSKRLCAESHQPQKQKRVTQFPRPFGQDPERGPKRPLEAPEVPLHNKSSKKNPIPRLPVPVRVDGRVPATVSGAGASSLSSPWHIYTKLMREDQAGPAIVAYASNTRPGQDACLRFCAIKKYRGHGRTIIEYGRKSHANLVAMVDVFEHDDYISVAYEHMIMSLTALRASPLSLFHETEIAFICKQESHPYSLLASTNDRQILNGIVFIHKELQLAHGDVSCDNVLLSRQGEIKIGKCQPGDLLQALRLLANIGQSLLERRTDKDQDLKQLGGILLKLLEPGSSWPSNHPQLKEPDKWSATAVDFLEKTHSMSLSNLIHHNFLKLTASNHLLIKHVWTAERSVKRDWRPIEVSEQSELI